jgi:uncharacterized protein (DUF488 family)
MADTASENRPTVWTIGHSNHPEARFLELLRQHGIELVADVRSSPFSRYASHCNKGVIESALRAGAIRYVFLGNLLGGRAEGEQSYDLQEAVRYERMAESDRFRRGIERLVQEVPTQRVAVMCGEEDPTHCHRRLLIGRVLVQRGVSVVHVRGDGRLQTEEEVADAEWFARTKGQRTLFDLEEADAWRATRDRRTAAPGSRRASGAG